MRFATRMMCVASEPVMNEIYDPAVSWFTQTPVNLNLLNQTTVDSK